jgi:hypothetical protein
MGEEELDRLLALLPPRTAAPDFTRRVLERLGRRPPARAPRLRLAAAACLILIVLAGAAVSVFHQRRERARLAAIRAEQRQIAAELEVLKRATRVADPVVYLGGDDRVDYVLDLRQFQPVQPASRRSAPPAREGPL